MAQPYQLVAQLPGQMQIVQRIWDGAFIPFDPANRDYAEFQRWLDAGNEPDPASPPEPPPPVPLELAAHPEGPMDAVTKDYVDIAFIDLYGRIATLLPAGQP